MVNLVSDFDWLLGMTEEFFNLLLNCILSTLEVSLATTTGAGAVGTSTFLENTFLKALKQKIQRFAS